MYRIVFLGFFLLFQIFNSQKVLYVSPIGSDENSGSLNSPLSTLSKAFETAGGCTKDSVQIKVLPGNYYMNKTLSLTEMLDRSKNTRISIIGDNSEKTIFYGGEPLKPTKDPQTNNWIIKKKSTKTQQFLSINGETRAITQYPLTGFEKVKNSLFLDDYFKINISDELNSVLKKMSIEEVKNIYGTFYVKWTVIIRYISDYDSKAKTLTFKGPKLPTLYYLEDNKTNYKLNNLPINLYPGKWYYKDGNTIVYNPQVNENITTSIAVVPDLDYILKIKGNISKKVSYITFKNLVFNSFGKSIPSEGYFPDQAASKIDAVITVDHAENISFINNKFSNIQSHIFWFRNNAHLINSEDSKFTNLGSGVAKIGNFKYDYNSLATSQIKMVNNYINKGGLIYPDAVAINIINSFSNNISHNEISDFSYTGVSVGWVWGYGESLSKNNLISYNHIFNIGKGDLDDMSGIYTLGVSDGTVIKNNVVHDVISNNYGGWGIYTDEGSSNILIENNLVYNCKSAGFHQHYGKNNIIRNNIFAYNGDAELEATKVEDHQSLIFYDNIIVHNNNNFFGLNWQNVNMKKYNNIYFSKSNENLSINSVKISDDNSKILNPNLVKKKFYYTVDNKNIFKLTKFKNIDFSKVGIIN